MKTKKARLLLVEDNRVIQAALAEALGSTFDIVATLDTADAASAWLDAHADGWDLAVIDIFLRQGHGFQVLRRCATRSATQTAVVLSNYTREPARSSALDHGAAAVFDKSFELEAFIAYCLAHAEAHARQQERVAAQEAARRPRTHGARTPLVAA